MEQDYGFSTLFNLYTYYVAFTAHYVAYLMYQVAFNFKLIFLFVVNLRNTYTFSVSHYRMSVKG